MDLATIEMPVHEARKKFLEYREAVRGRHYDEDHQMMVGYRQLAKGNRLLKMSETLAKGGWNGRGLPRLALAKADDLNKPERQNEIHVRVERPGNGVATVIYSPKPWRDHPSNSGMRAGVTRFNLPGLEVNPPSRWDDWLAIVPLVPPALRPKSLTNYFILFEATWFLRTPRLKGDPALVRHIGGDLWAVVATWDLTELERAVLAVR